MFFYLNKYTNTMRYCPIGLMHVMSHDINRDSGVKQFKVMIDYCYQFIRARTHINHDKHKVLMAIIVIM